MRDGLRIGLVALLCLLLEGLVINSCRRNWWCNVCPHASFSAANQCAVRRATYLRVGRALLEVGAMVMFRARTARGARAAR